MPDIRQHLSYEEPLLAAHKELSLMQLLVEDLPMSRVKFNVNTEYAYLQNFKILQSVLLEPLSKSIGKTYTMQMPLQNTVLIASSQWNPW